MIVAQIGEGIHVKESGRVKGRIEHESEITVPIAVDILRTRDGSTRIFIISHLVADRVPGRREVDESHDRLLMLLEIVIVVQTEVLGERRLQSRVTSADVQRVAVIVDVKQVADRRLAAVTTVVEAQLPSIAMLPTEVERRGEVSHRTGRISSKNRTILLGNILNIV